MTPNVRFKEAIDHLTAKIDIPTASHSDMRGEAHAKAFTVAGATKQAIVGDFHKSINRMIDEGLTIEDFRKDFDEIVDKHGWSYKGKRGWRTRVIYDTNMRTARAAGKWQQFQRLKNSRPYLQYLSVDDARTRDAHRQWHERVFPIDHPWWDTHYPLNGWGCRCTVRSLSQRDIDKAGLQIEEAPPLNPTPRIDLQTGEVLGDVPEGIDTGWDYNVGKSWLGPDLAFGKRAIALPEALQERVLNNTELLTKLIAKPYKSWAANVLDDNNSRGEIRTVGYLSHEVVKFAAEKGIGVNTATITLKDARLRRMVRGLKKRNDIALSREQLLNIPVSLQTATVIWDIRHKALIYLFDGDKNKGKTGKIAVSINFNSKGEVSNSIRSAGIGRAENFKDRNQYELIKGKL